MILAAGFGTRMRRLSDTLPKPLIPVHGRALIDHALDRLQDAGVEEVLVNVHYRAQQMDAHLAARERPRIVLQHETKLLGTGGGVAHAWPRLTEGDKDLPVYVINSDSLWLDDTVSALDRLRGAWDEDTDAVLLLQRSTVAVGYEGAGDFFLDPNGVARRRDENEIAPYVFTGLQLLGGRLLDHAPPPPFSLNLLYDRALEAGRLTAIVHDGEWYHVGTPAALVEVEQLLRRPHYDRGNADRASGDR